MRLCKIIPYGFLTVIMHVSPGCTAETRTAEGLEHKAANVSDPNSDEYFQNHNDVLQNYIRIYTELLNRPWNEQDFFLAENDCTRRGGTHRFWSLSTFNLLDAIPQYEPLSEEFGERKTATRYLFDPLGSVKLDAGDVVITWSDGTVIVDSLLDARIQPTLSCPYPFGFSSISNLALIAAVPFNSESTDHGADRWHGLVNGKLHSTDVSLFHEKIPSELIMRPEEDEVSFSPFLDPIAPTKQGFYMEQYLSFGRMVGVDNTGVEHVLFIRHNWEAPEDCSAPHLMKIEKQRDQTRKQLRKLLSELLPATPVVFVPF